MTELEHESCQSSDGPVRFYYSHWPTRGFDLPDHVYVGCPHHPLDPLPNDGRWTVQSVHPLTVTPSVYWTDCGCHGFITDGEWVSATLPTCGACNITYNTDRCPRCGSEPTSPVYHAGEPRTA